MAAREGCRAGPINSCIENNVCLRLRNSREKVCMSTLCVHDSVYVRELFTTCKGYRAIEKLHANLALSICSGQSIKLNYDGRM